jgi:hypothetical protein
MATRFGLCDRCVHQRLVRSGRGSVFSLCERSRTDDRYPKYPRVPVAACPGFTPRQPHEDPPQRA